MNTFRILFLIKRILDLFIGLIGIIYLSIGAFAGDLLQASVERTGEPLPFITTVVFVFVGILLLVLALITEIPALLASTRFKQRRGRTFIMVAAAVNCLTGILVILLCIFTIIELQKPNVKMLFAENGG